MCIKDKDKEVVRGLKNGDDRKSLHVNIAACNAERDLQPGDSCMSREDAKLYLLRKKFVFTILHSFIDYSDIENPVKTIPDEFIEIYLAPKEVKNLKVTLQSH